MARQLEVYQLIERSLIKKYRKELWNPFIECVKAYNLVTENSKITVKLNGDAKTTLSAKLLQQLQRVSDVPFELYFAENGISGQVAEKLNIPLSVCPESTAFVDSVNFDDVVAQALKGIMYESKIGVTLPKYVENGVTYINPLYCIKSLHINAWLNYNCLDLDNGFSLNSKDVKIFNLLRELRERDGSIEDSIFKSVHSVCLDTMVGYNYNESKHFYLDNY